MSPRAGPAGVHEAEPGAEPAELAQKGAPPPSRTSQARTPRRLAAEIGLVERGASASPSLRAARRSFPRGSATRQSFRTTFSPRGSATKSGAPRFCTQVQNLGRRTPITAR